MPKGFTQEESGFYKNRLLETGEKLFSTYGLKRVTIDQIVKEVGIAKGSFYKFYRNKEDLCYDCIMEIERKVRLDIIKDLSELEPNTGVLIAYILRSIPKVISENPLLTMLQDKGQLETLMLRVDPQKHNDNYDGDLDFFNSIFKGSGVEDEDELHGLLALVWSMVFLSSNSDFLNGQYENLLKLLEKLLKSYYKGDTPEVKND